MTYSTNSTHSVVDTTRTKTALYDLETATRTKNYIAIWDSNIVENKLAVAVRSIVVTVDRKHALDCDTLGVGWDKNNRLLSVDVLVSGVALGHHDVDLASWVAGSA